MLSRKSLKRLMANPKKMDVSITLEENGKYTVANDTLGLGGSFDSLSMASDYVWVMQKGYKTIEAYKKATGKKKIPSGGGWKFWKLAPPKVSPEVSPEKSPDVPAQPQEKPKLPDTFSPQTGVKSVLKSTTNFMQMKQNVKGNIIGDTALLVLGKENTWVTVKHKSGDFYQYGDEVITGAELASMLLGDTVFEAGTFTPPKPENVIPEVSPPPGKKLAAFVTNDVHDSLHSWKYGQTPPKSVLYIIKNALANEGYQIILGSEYPVTITYDGGGFYIGTDDPISETKVFSLIKLYADKPEQLIIVSDDPAQATNLDAYALPKEPGEPNWEWFDAKPVEPGKINPNYEAVAAMPDGSKFAYVHPDSKTVGDIWTKENDVWTNKKTGKVKANSNVADDLSVPSGNVKPVFQVAEKPAVMVANEQILPFVVAASMEALPYPDNTNQKAISDWIKDIAHKSQNPIITFGKNKNFQTYQLSDEGKWFTINKYTGAMQGEPLTHIQLRIALLKDLKKWIQPGATKVPDYSVQAFTYAGEQYYEYSEVVEPVSYHPHYAQIKPKVSDSVLSEFLKNAPVGTIAASKADETTFATQFTKIGDDTWENPLGEVQNGDGKQFTDSSIQFFIEYDAGSKEYIKFPEKPVAAPQTTSDDKLNLFPKKEGENDWEWLSLEDVGVKTFQEATEKLAVGTSIAAYNGDTEGVGSVVTKIGDNSWKMTDPNTPELDNEAYGKLLEITTEDPMMKIAVKPVSKGAAPDAPVTALELPPIPNFDDEQKEILDKINKKHGDGWQIIDYGWEPEQLKSVLEQAPLGTEISGFLDSNAKPMVDNPYVKTEAGWSFKHPNGQEQIFTDNYMIEWALEYSDVITTAIKFPGTSPDKPATAPELPPILNVTDKQVAAMQQIKEKHGDGWQLVSYDWEPSDFMDVLQQAPVGTEVNAFANATGTKVLSNSFKKGKDGWATIEEFSGKKVHDDFWVNEWALDKNDEITTVIKFPGTSPASPQTPAKLKKAMTVPNAVPASKEILDLMGISDVGWNTAMNAVADDNETKIAKKSPLIPAYVPPQGLILQGEHNGKTYYLVNALSGYNTDGEPAKNCSFAIFEADGTKWVSYPHATAAGALKTVAGKINGFPNDLKSIKKIFNLDKLAFPADITAQEIMNGDVPAQASEPGKHVSKKKEKTAPVTNTVSFTQYVQHKLPNAKFKTDPGDDKHTYLTLNFADDENAVETLQNFLNEHGLDTIKKSGHLGAFIKVSNDFLAQGFTATQAELDADGYAKQVSDENWETMPEGVQKIIIPGAMTPGALVDQIAKWPDETQLYEPQADKVWTKKGDALFWGEMGVDLYKAAVKLQEKHSQNHMSVVPPGVSLSEVELPKPDPSEASKTELSKEQQEKLKKAKEVSEWQKQFDSGISPDAQHVLNYMNADYVKAVKEQQGLYLKQKGSDLYIQAVPPAPDITDYFKKKNIKSEAVTSPLGDFQKVPVAALKTTYKKAGVITGPDKLQYPKGTTFKNITVNHTAKEFVEGKVTKIKDHKSKPETHVTLKVSGTGDEQKQLLTDLISEYNLDAEEIITGSQNVLVGVTKESLDQIIKTETVVQPQIPKQPDTFIAKPLPSFSEKPKDGQKAIRNYFDLHNADAIVPEQSGRFIRCGKFGALRDNQIRMRKVEDADGKKYVEFFGEFNDPTKAVNTAQAEGSLSHGTKYFKSAAVTDNKTLGGYIKRQNYDEISGIIKESGKNIVNIGYNCLQTTTANNSEVTLINQSSYRSMHGTFTVRIQEGQDYMDELTKAMDAMGQDPGKVLAEPTDADDELYKMDAVCKALLGPAGQYHWNQYYEPTKESMQAFIDSKGKYAKELLANTDIEYGFNGKHSVYVKEDEAIKKNGALFSYSCRSGATSAFARLLNKEEGLWSNKTKIINGVIGSPSSLEQDHKHGSTHVSYCRIGNAKSTGTDWSNINYLGPKQIYHPRAFKRLDWYAHQSDQFGDTKNTVRNRREALGNAASTNEILFIDGMSNNDMAGIVCYKEADYKELMDLCAKRGITEFNGIPINEFIIQYSGFDRNYIQANLKGLQEGVLK
jgi:hypothetical protein